MRNTSTKIKQLCKDCEHLKALPELNHSGVEFLGTCEFQEFTFLINHNNCKKFKSK